MIIFKVYLENLSTTIIHIDNETNFLVVNKVT